MKNLLIVTVILILMNSFIGSSYYYTESSSNSLANPVQSSAISSSYLPVDSFVLPVQSNQNPVHFQIKSLLSALHFSILSTKSYPVSDADHDLISKLLITPNLRLLATTILRL